MKKLPTMAGALLVVIAAAVVVYLPAGARGAYLLYWGLYWGPFEL